MITDAPKRITFEQMKSHPFFKGFDWEGCRSLAAPIVPNLSSEIDTTNFDKFEDAEESEEAAGADNKASEAFIGYTFKRVEEPKPLSSGFFDHP